MRSSISFVVVLAAVYVAVLLSNNVSPYRNGYGAADAFSVVHTISRRGDVLGEVVRGRSSPVVIFSSTDEDAATTGIREGLVAAGSTLQSQLASAFSALDESDQYDAVLTGLCAKILDQPTMSGDDVIVALQDAVQLLEEMNSRKVQAGSRSLMALVDVRILL